MRYEMRLNFKEKLLGLFLLVLGLTIQGCIEEPAIVPIKRPFSEIRVVNLSNNVDNMRILIDDAQPVSTLNSLAITGATSYFEVKSGVRNFKIFNQSGDKVFEKDITVISYDRTSIVFTGFYSPSIDFNTFANFDISEGEVYVSSAPSAGNLNVYIVNGAAAVDTFSSRSFEIRATITPTGGTPRDTTYRVSGTDTSVAIVEFAKTYSIGNTTPGDYSFHFFDLEDSVTVNAPTVTLTSGMRYYMFIYGSPNAVQFVNNAVTPQPTRSK
jgi:hypothetical protein